MPEFILPSGAALLVNMAKFPAAKALHDDLLRALKGTNVAALDITKLATDFKVGNYMALNELTDKIMSVAAAPEIMTDILKCAESAGYMPGGPNTAVLKVDMALFDDVKYAEQARGDYYHIGLKILEVNLKPFFQALISALKTAAPISAENQPLK